MRDEGLIETFDGRGFVVPGAPQGADPLRIDLGDAGLELPADLSSFVSNRREQTYPEVEHAVAACLAYGRFMLNESALAEHYDVSRTVAHEVLTQLERAIVQDSNKRWHAGPLSAAEFAHHFEMRWLLEPQALRHAFPSLARQDLLARADRVGAAGDGPVPPPSSKRSRPIFTSARWPHASTRRCSTPCAAASG